MIEEVIAGEKGLDVYEAASAILDVSNANIAQAIRYVSVERGLDPAEFILVAFGGAGPVQAVAIARDLGMAVLVPESPGVLCAMGVLAKDNQIDFSQTRILSDWSVDMMNEVETLYADLEERAAATFRHGGLSTETLLVERSVDARYVGQNFEIPIPVPGAALDTEAFQALKETFHETHKRLYGYHQPDKVVELVTFRITASLPVAKPDLKRFVAKRGAGPEPSARREVFFEDEGGFVECPIYERQDLAAGDRIPGPVVIEQMDATTVIPPDFEAEVDDFLNLYIARRT